MSRIMGIRARTLPWVTLAMCLGLMGNTATAQSIQGTATYRERMALPLAAVLEVALEDASRADAPAETIARTRVASPGNPPIAFTIASDPAKILPDHRYVVRARILLDDKLLFITDTAPRVITRGSPTSVTMMLRRVGAGQAAPPNPAGSRPLEGTYWKAIEVAGKPTPTQDANREAYLLFQPGGRLSGSDGCNRIVSSYELKGDVITFGQVAGTQMACLNTGEIERAFRDGLKSATRSTIVGDRLELFDPAGRRVAAFTAGAQTLPSTSPRLEGTSWQLVKFQGSDDTTLTPDDGAKYTIEFGAGGRLTARIDCNRGRGTWKSSGSNQLQFGPLALTRAQCPAESLHDQIVKQWGHIRSYVIKDGHLYLSLTADGGIYEFEPVTKPSLTVKDYDDFYGIVILKAKNGTKDQWLASYDPVVNFISRVRQDVEKLPDATQRALAKAVHDNGYWKGQEVRVRNAADPFVGAKLKAGDERLKAVLTPQGYDAYRSRYTQGSKGYRFTLEVAADRAALYRLEGKDIPRLSEIPATTTIVNANAQSWDDLVADAESYPDPRERMGVIVRNQFNAIASALALMRASQPRTDAEMDYATAVIWRYTGHFSGKNGWEQEPLVRIPYEQLPEAEKVKDRPVWKAVREALKAHPI